jgi:Meiotically up-regulated gene 113
MGPFDYSTVGILSRKRKSTTVPQAELPRKMCYSLPAVKKLMDKQHIVDEIRRTAKANGGVPLGRGRFLKETGIRESDWRGRIWVRWSDALREAGFEPNKRQTAIDDSVLLEKLIALMRELGHFPVAAEIGLKSSQNSSFPNPKTFSRLGLKQELAAKVLAYCETRSGYEDVSAICTASLAKPTVPEKSDDGFDGSEVFGFVYLMKSGRHYKIGRSNAVGRREYELGIHLPDPLSTIHKIKTDDPVGIEAYWHKRFDAKRKGGEWFALDASDVRAFRRRKFM